MQIEIRRFGVGNRRPGGPIGSVGLSGQVLHSDGRGNVSELAFARNARTEPHASPNSALFIVVEGGGWVGVGDMRTRIAAGEAAVWPADIPHAAWTEHSEMRAFIVEFTRRRRQRHGRGPGARRERRRDAGRARHGTARATGGAPGLGRPRRGRASLTSGRGRGLRSGPAQPLLRGHSQLPGQVPGATPRPADRGDRADPHGRRETNARQARVECGRVLARLEDVAQAVLLEVAGEPAEAFGVAGHQRPEIRLRVEVGGVDVGRCVRHRAMREVEVASELQRARIVGEQIAGRPGQHGRDAAVDA